MDVSLKTNLTTVDDSLADITGALDHSPNITTQLTSHRNVTVIDSLTQDRMGGGGQGYLFLQSFNSPLASASGEIWLYDGDSTTGELIAHTIVPAGTGQVICGFPCFFLNGWTVKCKGGGVNELTINATWLTVEPAGQVVETALYDSKIRQENATTNYGTQTSIQTRNQTGNHEKAMLYFALSSIAGGSQVTSSVLRLTVVSNVSDQILKVYRVNYPWVEEQVTYNIRSTGINWDTAGLGSDTDYEATEYASIEIDKLAGQTIDIDLTTLVNEWLDGSYPNYGILLNIPQVDGGANAAFYSSENSTDKPILITTY